MDRKLAIILLLSVLLFGANLGGTSIYILDEAKNSTAAREMLENHSIVPTFNYELRTDKPPLHYFLMMLAYSLFGVNEFAARFFSSIMGIALIMCSFLFIRKYLNAAIATWSSLVMLSSIQIVIQFHMAVPDPFLIFFFTTAMFCFYSCYVEKKKFWAYIGYFAISLAVLSKGPVAVLLAAAVWGLFLIANKDFSLKTLMSLRLAEGLVIFVSVTVPWYLAVHFQTHGEWTKGFFLQHNISRFTSTMEGHGGSFLLIPLYVIMGLFPFSIFILQAIGNFWKNRSNPFLLFVGITSIVIVIFFCFSKTKLPSYPAISFPFLSILLGHYIAGHLKTWDKTMVWSTVLYLLIAIAIPLAIYIVIDDLMNLPDLGYVAYAFILLPLGAFAAIMLFYRNQARSAFMVISFSWITTIVLFFYVVFPPIDRKNPVMTALPQIRLNEPVFYYGRYNPSFSFYLKRKIVAMNDSSDLQRIDPPITVLSMKKKLSDLQSLQSNYEIIHSSREFFEPYYSVVLHRSPKTISFK